MREDLLQIAPLRVAFLGGELSVATLIERVVTRIAEWNDPALWITRTSDAELRKRASELDAAAAADPDLIKRLPLFGIPFAVKDNIDVVGMPTTAACPAFAYSPYEAAPVVMHLLSADAVLIGKTNLDQFATGLVGARSPGSAVAAAAGLVSFALGTDTAGSGHVPAAFNGIVGAKADPGLEPARFDC